MQLHAKGAGDQVQQPFTARGALECTERICCCHAQAFVKARGDGLGFDLSKAEFHFDADNSTAGVWIDGQPQPRCIGNLHLAGCTAATCYSRNMFTDTKWLLSAVLCVSLYAHLCQ